jgi:hypothetical protein
MIETIAEQDARRRTAIIGASLAGVKALVHAAAAVVFYFLDQDVVGAGLQVAGTVIWAGKAAWEVW